MSRRPKPPTVMVDGTESVVLTVDEYERLATLRRQVGGQNTRIHTLKQKLKEAQELLADIEQTIAAFPECDHGDPECPPCRLLASVRSRAVSGLRALE